MTLGLLLIAAATYAIAAHTLDHHGTCAACGEPTHLHDGLCPDCLAVDE